MRHLADKDDNAARFDNGFLNKSEGKTISKKLWNLACFVLDKGDFEDGLGSDGITPIRQWYYNFKKHHGDVTGSGKDKHGSSCSFKGVRLIASVDSFDGKNEGYLVNTMFPTGPFQDVHA